MKLVLCCDYGLDDALATYDALSHARADGYEETFLVAVGGNVPRSVALRNAKKLVANLDFPRPPLTIVDTTAEPQPERFLRDVHGDDGMGDLFPDRPCDAPVLTFGEFTEALCGDYALLSLGPMTLVPRILACGRCVRFLFMGGNIAEVPNYEGYEFNHALDRAAFSEAVRMPHGAVTMDTCRHPLLNIQDAPPAGEGIARAIARRCRELTLRTGEKGCYIWDDVAVKALRHPDWFEAETRTDPDGNRLRVLRYVHGKPYGEIIGE